MDRHPFLSHQSGGEPQPKAKKVAGDRVQIQRVVCLLPVQENRDRCDGHMGQTQDHQHKRPSGKINQAQLHDRTPRHDTRSLVVKPDAVRAVAHIKVKVGDGSGARDQNLVSPAPGFPLRSSRHQIVCRNTSTERAPHRPDANLKCAVLLDSVVTRC